MRTGIANAPLHGGFCPPWLFEKMKSLSAAITQVIVLEYGPAEMLRRLSDPVWFQSFGSVLGFDWHSSGLTTVVCGALKEGLRDAEGEIGLFFAGGKGKASRKTPNEIVEAGEKYGLSNNLADLQRTSRLVAKVDSAAVQDGYQLYHHFFVFDRQGNWAVVQQGMNDENRYARRYHWLSENLKSFVQDPHQGICGVQESGVLNLVSNDNQSTRMASVELCKEKPEHIAGVMQMFTDYQKEHHTAGSIKQLSLFEEPKLTMPAAHPIPRSAHLNKMLYQLYEQPPSNYEKLLETAGVGASTLRALAMVAEVTHGARPSYEDPVRYAFAHGGKDGFPFPVNRDDVGKSLEVLQTAIKKAKIGDREKLDALRRIGNQEKKLLR